MCGHFRSVFHRLLCVRNIPLPLSFPSLSIDLIYWPGLTRHQNLRCYQKTIFLVEVLKVTRYDWQKSHFSPGQSVQEAEGGGQKFVPAIENDASPIRSPAVFITLFLTRLFNRVFVLCLHNSITVIFASNQKWCSHYYCCGVCGSFLSSRQFRSSIHLFDARYKRGSYCWVYWVTRWWLTMEGHGEFPELLRD